MKMMTIKNLNESVDTLTAFIQKLNELLIIQTSRDISDMEIFEEYDDDYEIVATEIGVDKHRHCEYSTTVIKLLSGKFESALVGVFVISKIYNENNSAEDFGHELVFYEMVEVMRPTYTQKSI